MSRYFFYAGFKSKLLELGDIDLAGVDLLADFSGSHVVDGASDRVASSKNLLNSSRKVTSHRARAHDLGNLNNLVDGQISVVLDVLGSLLPVPDRLLQLTNHHGGGRGNKLNSRLTVLNDQLHGNLQSLPIEGSLLDVFSDLLGVKTKGTNPVAKC